MTREVYIEKHKRGYFGLLFLILFIAWNVVMAIWLLGFSMHVNEATQSASTQAESAVVTVGSGIGFIMMLILWGMGSVITGILALLSRGSKQL